MSIKILVLLDSGPLGIVTHPRANDEIRKTLKKFSDFTKNKKIQVRIPEICDYEVRRKLIREDFQKSIRVLDQFCHERKQLIPLTSEAMLEAANLWAWTRKKAIPTTNDDKLDGDVILAAQAICIKREKEFDRVIILTGNPKDISRFSEYGIDTWDWKQAEVDWEKNIITIYTPNNMDSEVLDLNFD